MSDVKLEDGREITFDLNKISIKEYRALFDNAQPEADEYATLAKVTGLSAEAIGDLGFLDWRHLYRAFIERCRNPDADPN